MKILVFSPGYPDSKKSEYPFVKELVDEWARQGHTCTVVATYSIIKNKGFCPYKTIEKYNGGGSVTIFRPNVLTFSNFRLFGICLSNLFQDLGVKRVIRSILEEQDVVYCHFWKSGHYGFFYSRKHNTPLFIATGESNVKHLLRDIDTSFAKYVKGVIAVSSKNKDESIALGLTNADKCVVFPNSVNPRLFKKLDKNKCRERLGFSHDAFIVAFVGSFKENKGPHRVSEAIGLITGTSVYSIFIGSGKIQPSAPNILFSGSVMHEDVPYFLNAADVFVLPTLAEGCCNAIIEAMTCGLPIISSNLPFNWDILNQDNSIMIDPNNIQQIADAIKLLRDDPSKRKALSVGALETAKNLTIEHRAKGILDFISNKIMNDGCCRLSCAT